jgi:hypothetical protein
MCFTQEYYNDIIPNAKIANKDIEVYKYVKGNYPLTVDNTKFISYIYTFEYIANKKNKKIQLKPRLCMRFDLNPWLEINFNDINDCPMIAIDEGYHSYINLNTVEKFILDNPLIYPIIEQSKIYSYYIGKFIIPKGSKFYKNNSGEVVSSCLIYTGKYKKFITTFENNYYI